MKFYSNLKTITVLTSLAVLVVCGTTNKNMDFAQSKTMINNDQEIIKIYDLYAINLKPILKKYMAVVLD